jgi:Big-like domain-containing protein/leishmanolysin
MLTSPRCRTTRLWSALLALALGACGGGSEPNVPTEITLEPSALSFSSVGAAQQLTATVLDQNGNPLPEETVTWSTSSEVIATVSPTGVVTSTGPGTAEITATAGAATGTAPVTVTQTPAVLEQVSGDGQAAVEGQSLALPLVVRARDASGTVIPNLPVRFEVTQGGGNVEPKDAETGVDGTASAVLRVGPAAGQPQQVLATIVGTGLTATFNAIATNPAATIDVFDGNGQSAPAGANVPVAPAVKVLDASDAPVPGVQVRFEVTRGGGTIVGGLKLTNADGVAAPDSWTLGPSGINTLNVTVDGQTVAGEPLMFVATTDAATGYNIKIRYLGSPSGEQLLAFAEAEIRWESLITGDLPDVPIDVPSNSNPCGDGLPDISETVDDILILAELQSIDGPFGVVGQAGFCIRRASNDLPVLGIMFFDTDDLEELGALNLLDEVVLHEMSHVMGFGTLWPTQGLLADPVGLGGTDPHFTGPQSITAFNEAGGAAYTGAKVPVENDEDRFGVGTLDSHWRESVFDNELMTGELNDGVNPLSAISIRALADQGYTVNAGGADPYTLPLTALRTGPRGRTFALHNDVLRFPIWRVDRTGQLRREQER